MNEMTQEQIDNIPQDQTENFPSCVEEHKFQNIFEANAFQLGFSTAESPNTLIGKCFTRGGKYIVRTFVGELPTVKQPRNHRYP